MLHLCRHVHLSVIQILILCCIAQPGKAQTLPEIEWQRCLGGLKADWAESILRTSEGGLVLTGRTYGDIDGYRGGTDDFFVVKLNSTGELEWQKCFGGSAADAATCLIQTSDGGFAIAGHTQSDDGDVSGNHGLYDGWIIKLTSKGQLEWQRSIGGSGTEDIYSIIQTSDGDLVVVGATTSNDGDVSGQHGDGGPASSDVWVVKLRDSGEIVWQKCLGGSAKDESYSIVQTSDKGFILAGETSSNNGDVKGKHVGYQDGWIVKLYRDGNIEWQKCLGGSEYDRLLSIIQTPDGSYVTSGVTQSHDGDVSGLHSKDSTAARGDSWVVRLDPAGEMIWQKCFGGADDDEAHSIYKTLDGGFIFVGATQSNDGDVFGYHGSRGRDDVWVVKLGVEGSLEWQKCLGGSGQDYGASLLQLSASEYIIAGLAGSVDGDVVGIHGTGDPADAWVVKLKTPLGGINDQPVEDCAFHTYPNPANKKIRVTYDALQSLSNFTITITNSEGLLQDRVSLSELGRGNHEIDLDLQRLASGKYTVTFMRDNFSKSIPVFVLH